MGIACVMEAAQSYKAETRVPYIMYMYIPGTLFCEKYSTIHFSSAIKQRYSHRAQYILFPPISVTRTRLELPERVLNIICMMKLHLIKLPLHNYSSNEELDY